MEKSILTVKSTQAGNLYQYLKSFVFIVALFIILPTNILYYHIFGISIKTLCVLISIYIICYQVYVGLKTAFKLYQVTTERIIVRTGVFTSNRHEIELYRVKDYEITQTFIERLFGLHTLLLITVDRSSKNVIFRSIKDANQVSDTIRHQVEKIKTEKGMLIME